MNVWSKNNQISSKVLFSVVAYDMINDTVYGTPNNGTRINVDRVKRLKV